MNLFKAVALGVIAATLSACSTMDIASRNAPLETPRLEAQQVAEVARDYSLHSINFVVPASLRVSEANSYYPIADIVWRGDPFGNRPEQITDIFQNAIAAAGEGLTGTTPVTVDVTLMRFHSLTERTRYSVGGVHSIKFQMTVRDAQTGEVLEGPRVINADLPGLGGYAAIQADAEGQGQKVRIMTHLTSLFYRELSGTRPAADATAGT
ncbi:MAG: hypothetical protein KJP02_08455 [Octadecabacter sp.]|nr:hypothetical protein [Octadecabacter sp.]